MNLQDHTVIHRHGHYEVLRRSHVVTWPTGRSIGLHLVNVDGYLAPYLRCLLDDSLHAIVFDLRDLCKELDAEVRSTHARDVQGLIEYTLRARFADAPICVTKISINLRAAWLFAAPAPRHITTWSGMAVAA